jgi:Secretion system C-terminal sorting domain
MFCLTGLFHKDTLFSEKLIHPSSSAGKRNWLPIDNKNGEKGNNLFIVYPNPTTGSVNLMLTDGMDEEEKGVSVIEEVDVYGHIIRQIDIGNENSNNLVLDLPDSGFYLVILRTNGRIVATSRIISLQ